MRCAVLFAVVLSATSAQLNEDNYQIVTTMLNAPIRKEYARKIDNVSFNTLDDYEDEAIDPITQSDTSHSHVVKKEKAILDFPVVENSTDEEGGRNMNYDGSVVQDGFQKLRDLYSGCNKKINRKIRYLMDTVKTRSNTQKDLFEFKEFVLSLVSCLKVSGFRYLDDVLDGEVIPVTDYIDLVRDKRGAGNSNVVKIIPTLLNGKLSFPNDEPRNQTKGEYAADILHGNWGILLMDRMETLLDSHSVKFHMGQTAVEGRSRRRNHRMFAMMVMGFMIMTSILIPMGFQFLTVLGGKSILMAKMALIMSAINGLKKIATNNVGYGFYHTAPGVVHGGPHHHDFHEKVFQIKPEDSSMPFNIL